MKYLLVIDSLGSGGAQRLFVQLAKALSDKGHEVVVFTYDQSENFFYEDFVSNGIKVFSFRKPKKGFSIKTLLSLHQLIKSGFDCVIATMHSPSIYAALANLGVRRNALILCEVGSSSAPVSFIKKFLFILSCLLASSVVTNSYRETQHLSRFPFLKNKVKTIWNGYQVKEYPFHHREGRLEDKLRILIVGRLAYPKNGVNVLKALKLFHFRNGWMPEVTWAGRKETDSLSLKMQNDMQAILDSDVALREKLNFIGEVKDIEKLYLSNDVLLHASLYEGLPNVICEAMLLGCLVVASNVADHKIILGDGPRGFLCEPESMESICRSLEKVANLTVQEFSGIVQEARNYAETEFDVNLRVGEYVKLAKVIS